MRACSRCVAGSISACDEACGTGKRNQTVIGRAGATGQSHRHGGKQRSTCELGFKRTHTRPTHVYSMRSICSGATASMTGPPRCSIQPRTRIGRPSSPFGSMPADGEFSPMTLKNRYRKVARPTPPEIQIYCGAAFAHRQYLALNQCKLALRGCNSVEIFRPQRGEIGVGPETASRGACNSF